MTEHEHNHHKIHAGLSYENGGFVPTCDFPFDEIDRGNPLAAELTGASSENRAEDFAAALREILKWVWQDGKLTREPNLSYIRFLSMSAALDPTLLNNSSYKELGCAVGRGKATISAYALEFQRQFGVHLSRSRRESTTATFAKVQRGNSNRRRPHPETPSE